MSSPFSSIGQGRGEVETNQVPMPQDTAAIVRLFAEELAKPGLHSFHLEDGHPIVVGRYVDPDDLLMNRGVDTTPQQIIRTLENLWDAKHHQDGANTLIQTMLQIARFRMICSAVVVGSRDYLEKWLGIDPETSVALQVLDRSCDFGLLGMKGYIDPTLPEDVLVILGGDSVATTTASIKVGLLVKMEIKDGVPDRQGAQRDRAVVPRRESPSPSAEDNTGEGGVSEGSK